MDTEKVIIGLISVGAGWLLAQVTALIRDGYKAYQVKKCLLEELSDLNRQLEITLLSYSRSLQIHAIRGVGNLVPSKIASYIFKGYYKDAVLGLNQDQRLSFQVIHQGIESINKNIEELKEFTLELQKKNSLGEDSVTEKEVDYWGSHISANYKNVASIIWYINHHLTYPDCPKLVPGSERHEIFLKYYEGIDQEISKIINDAKKNLKIEDFKRAYDPETFKKFP